MKRRAMRRNTRRERVDNMLSESEVGGRVRLEGEELGYVEGNEG